MAINDILTQDEIDALLHGVIREEAEMTDTAGLPEAERIRTYNFDSQDRIVRGRLPALELINERFARGFRATLHRVLRGPATVSVNDVQMLKFSEYLSNLRIPSSLNLVHVKPFKGTALVMIDPQLVFVGVDRFFGGPGRDAARASDPEFTPMEARLIERMLTWIFRDLQDAWAPVVPIELHYLSTEVNPLCANIVSPTEVVVVASFRVELGASGGDLHFTLPYPMVGSLRDVLGAVVRDDPSETDARWALALRAGLERTEVELRAVLAEASLTLSQVARLKPGDIVAVDLPEWVTLCAEGTPVYRGQFGLFKGAHAVKIAQAITVSAVPPGEAS